MNRSLQNLDGFILERWCGVVVVGVVSWGGKAFWSVNCFILMTLIIITTIYLLLFFGRGQWSEGLGWVE